VWRGRLSLRKLWVLISHLPPDSAFVQAVVGGPHATERAILADIFDVLALANWQRGADPKSPPKQPKPYPRPGDTRRVTEKYDRLRAQAMAFRNTRGERG